ncbi:HET-domain-containing protein, partial [Epithele typhae]|uniref:HET-domain-containing protein n=1 Tax=Epithele typhae TaxID=378194 RepID=UPI002008AFC8
SVCKHCCEGLFASSLGLFVKVHSRKPTTGGFAYSTSWEDLAARAAVGCRWCQLVYSTKEDDADSHANTPLRIVVGSQGVLNTGTPEGTQDISVFVNDTLRFIGYVYTHQDDPSALHIVARPRLLDVGSSGSLCLAKAYLEDCISSHKNCLPQPDPPSLMPTRLVDCADPGAPRLVTTAGTRGTYTALSYVWGEAQPHSTVTANQAAYALFIDPAHLPQTILDAMAVTRALGLRYLRADTLCIIQDSLEDKLQELGRMRNVYRDAHVTIVAANAPRVSAGFLAPRPAVPPTPFSTFSRDVVLPFRCPAPQGTPARTGQIVVSPLWTYPDPPEHPLSQYDARAEPVSARGWCMQEYFMSPRALVFAAHTVQVHCHSAVRNVGGAFHDQSDRPPRLPAALLQPAPPQIGPEERAALRAAWQEALRDYSARAITVSSDKLVALSGVAEEFQRAFRTEYLAGLWRESLLADLLWNRREGSPAPTRQKAYRAPSWSWAAVDGQVMAGARAVTAGSFESKGGGVAEVVRCEVVLAHAELPFGEVLAATLVLRAPLVPCVWDEEDRRYICREVAVDEREDDDDDGLERFGFVYLDSDDDAGVRELWAVPIHWDPNIVGGIVVTSQEMQVYRRIGFFQVSANAGPLHWLRKVLPVDVMIV